MRTSFIIMVCVDVRKEDPREIEENGETSEGLDEEFVVYEKTVAVALPLTFTQQEGEDQTLQVTVRYQACSATDCLAPRLVQLQIPVKVEDLTEWPRRK